MKTLSFIFGDDSPRLRLLIITGLFAFLLQLFTNSFGQVAQTVRYEFVVSIVNTQGDMVHIEELDSTMTLMDIGPGTLIEFAAIANKGKVYTHWHVQGEKVNGLFIVERSKNGKDYEQIGFKKGIGVPIDNKILYCWVDENPVTGSCWYRLLKVYEDGGYYYGDAVRTTEKGQINPASKKGTLAIALQ